MNHTVEIEDAIGNILDASMTINNAKKRLSEAILAFPDNDKIQRIDGNPNCFMVRSSELGDNWTPEFHDFKKQYKMLVEIIEKAEPSKILDKLRKIVEKGTFIVRSSPLGASRTYRFHPKVVDYLSEVIMMKSYMYRQGYRYYVYVSPGNISYFFEHEYEKAKDYADKTKREVSALDE